MKIVYWTGTGNTAMMAAKIGEGVQKQGGEAELVDISTITPSELAAESAFALGCPSMGAEQLEESVVEPFMEELDSLISGKDIALFGSYGWGNGEWMDDWVNRCQQDGARVVGGEGIICNGAPEGDTEEALISLGSTLAGLAK